jgi:ArsR family transcriptional regulator, arsenate/arsenite/antimonite-responsive transcriptional repressor
MPRLTAILDPDIVNRRMAIRKQSDEEPLCCPEAELAVPADLLGLEGPEADEEIARLAKALGHPARVRIVRMLSRNPARVCSQIVGELPLAQSTVSEHLRILKDAGLIRSNQDGTRVGYCINHNVLRRLRALTAIL